ncbi:MAG: CDP-glycerol glycerophosphotransferase family protein [Oleiphilus sp.]
MSSKKFLFYACLNYSYAILRPLQAVIRERGDEVKWFFGGKKINPDYLADDEERLHTIEEVMSYAPDATFVPGNNVPVFIPGLKVAVFHGFNVEKRSDAKGHFNIRGYFDLYCTQGPNTTGPFKKLAEQKQHFSVKQTGWPALDTLFNSPDPTPNDKATILVCSTFTPRLSCAEPLFDTIKRLSLTGKWNWLIQFHPKMAKETVDKYKAIQHEHLTFVETDDVIPLLKQADVMVCDTSSVITMFLMLKKPVVTFKNASPKEHMIDIDDANYLEQSIEHALTRPEEKIQAIERFIDDTHPYTDGQSSARVLQAVDELLAGENRAAKRKPLNLLRNYQMRKKLKYWKF